MSLPAALQPTSATKMQEGRPNMFGRPSCAGIARGAPVLAIRRRDFRRSPLLAPPPRPRFLSAGQGTLPPVLSAVSALSKKKADPASGP